MASTINNKGNDKVVLESVSGVVKNGGTLLTAVKALLDAEYAQYKMENGVYPVPLVRTALTRVLARGT